jgi:hypothetical protein
MRRLIVLYRSPLAATTALAASATLTLDPKRRTSAMRSRRA